MLYRACRHLQRRLKTGFGALDRQQILEEVDVFDFRSARFRKQVGLAEIVFGEREAARRVAGIGDEAGYVIPHGRDVLEGGLHQGLVAGTNGVYEISESTGDPVSRRIIVETGTRDVDVDLGSGPDVALSCPSKLGCVACRVPIGIERCRTRTIAREKVLISMPGIE